MSPQSLEGCTPREDPSEETDSFSSFIVMEGPASSCQFWVITCSVLERVGFMESLFYCCCSVAQLCLTLCDPVDSSTPGFPFTISHSLLKFMSIESVMPSNHLILCHPLLLPPSVFPSIRVFSNELALGIRWAKYWSFSFSPSNEYSGLISFRMDWFDLLAVQGTLKSLLQQHCSKALILWSSAFIMVQLSHPYMSTRKTIALTIWTFVGKVMSLLFNTLSRFVIVFFPKEQASFNFMAAVNIHSDLEPKKLNHKTSLLEEGASRWGEVGPPCGQRESQDWPHSQYSLISHQDSRRKSRRSESTFVSYLPQTCAST